MKTFLAWTLHTSPSLILKGEHLSKSLQKEEEWEERFGSSCETELDLKGPPGKEEGAFHERALFKDLEMSGSSVITCRAAVLTCH